MRLLQKKWLVSLFLFLVSLGIYIPSAGSDFVWDDVETIENSYFAFQASSISSIIIPGEREEKKALYYRPLIYASMVLDKGVWGVSPLGFHLSNIIFNAFSTVLFYLLVLLLLKEFQIGRYHSAAFVSALLFAFYPMHVESVSWVSGRTDVICGLFFFLAFIAHILSFKHMYLLFVAAVGFSLSLLSKEVAVIFPLTVLILDFLTGRLARFSSIPRYGVYTGLLLLYIYLRGRGFVNIPELSGGRIAPESYVSPGAGALPEITGVIKVILGSYFLYFKKLIFPFEFNAFIESVPHGFYYIISSLAVLAMLLITAFISAVKYRGITAFSILWILITLIPSVLVSLFDLASTPAAERYLYIPSAGLCILLGYYIFRPGSGILTNRASWVFASLLLAVYLFFTVQRQGVWNDRLSLWEDTSRKSATSPIPHINYGMALLDAGREDEALKELLKNFGSGVDASNEAMSVTANNIGVVYINKEDLRSAENWFLRAYAYDPDYYKTNYHLGLVNYMKGYSENENSYYGVSEDYLKRALELRPGYGKAYLLLAMVFVELDDTEKAKSYAELALKSGLTDSTARKARKILETEN
ncbi:MAG: tetratricopeptide repeat protein [Deltaproteobacteria bacterium]